jgi:hypothetical protein
MDPDHARLQYRRLGRHVEAVIRSADSISMLDMAHSLRIWAEMKTFVDRQLQDLDMRIRWPNPRTNRRRDRVWHGTKFFHASLAGDVEINNVRVAGFSVIDRALTAEEVQRLYEAGRPEVAEVELAFFEWLGSSVVKVTQDERGEHEILTISREMLIKRVANVLGASHPQGMDRLSADENRFDPYVEELMEFRVLDRPLPYLLLVEIAQTITERLRPFLGDA